MVHSAVHGATALWPPDDTEESIVGVDRHQLDIISLRTGINEEAHRVAGAGPLPWQAISQIMYLGCERPDGSAYTVYPDVFVFPRPMNRSRGSYSLRQDGAPVLIIEVASDSTFEADMSLERGKAWSYAHAGMREYLVLDPTRVYVPEVGRGWRLVDGVYRPWLPDAMGRWRSSTIEMAFGVEDGLAAAYGTDGRRQLREGEIASALEAQHAAGRSAGIAEGRSAGKLEGKREALRHLARLRFGVVAALEQRIDAADEREIDLLIERILTAPGPDNL